MKKRLAACFISIMFAVILFACGNESASFTRVGGTDPVKLSEMTALGDGRITVSEGNSISLASEFSSADRPETLKAEDDLTVYRNADDKSAVLGTIKKGSTYTSYAKLADNWAKISFNGRIAYVKLPVKETETTTTTAETTAAPEQENADGGDYAGGGDYADGGDNDYTEPEVTEATDQDNDDDPPAIEPGEAATIPTEPDTGSTEPDPTEQTDPVTEPTDPEPTDPVPTDPDPDEPTDPSEPGPATDPTDEEP